MKPCRVLNYVADGIVGEIKTPVKVLCPHDRSVKVDTLGLWDTGATNTAITLSLANKLGLPPVRRAKVITSAGSGVALMYRIGIEIEGLGVAIETLAAGFPEFSQDDSVGILIGMNVICKGDFAISNYEGRTAMSFRFPSMGMIDFEKEIQG